jgi:hypothetical protein
MKITREIAINSLIKDDNVNTDLISDGYHTFGELYEHRIRLFIALCKEHAYYHDNKETQSKVVWCAKKHSDGTEMLGWFILGMGKEKGQQITYHLPNSYWDEVSQFAYQLNQAPEWDGHTSKDVIERLGNL